MVADYSHSSICNIQPSPSGFSYWFWLLVPPCGHNVWVYKGWQHCSPLFLLFISWSVHVCHSVQNYFSSSDRCVPDCWVAARLTSGPLASPERFLSLFSGLLSRDGKTGREWWVIYEARWEGLAIPCQEVVTRGEEVTHVEMPFCALHFSALTSEAAMKNTLYEKWLLLQVWPQLISAGDPHNL